MPQGPPGSGRKRRRNRRRNKHQRTLAPGPSGETIPLWTNYLKKLNIVMNIVMNIMVNLKALWSLSYEELKTRDETFGWTIVHAIVASPKIPLRVCEELFRLLKKKGLLSLIYARDNDDDTPLHSAANSRADPKVMELLLKQDTGFRRRLLQARNKSDETALQLAFERKDWPTVRILLKWSIHEKLLVELTGIGKGVRNTETLLHKAIELGQIQYLHVLLEVCKEFKLTDDQIIQGMLVTSKKGRTPWFYLLHRDLAEIKEVLGIVSESGISVDSLLTNTATKTSMLSDAYRENNEELIDLLLDVGANPDAVDARGLTPYERSKNIEALDLPPPAAASPVSLAQKEASANAQGPSHSAKPQLPHDSKQKKRRRKRGKRCQRDKHQETTSALRKSVPVVLPPSSRSLNQSDSSMIAKVTPVPTKELTPLQALPPPVLIESERKASTEPEDRVHPHVPIPLEGRAIKAFNVGYDVPPDDMT